MTQRPLTLADVIAYHVAEAENYTAKATGWARSAELLKTGHSVTNAVRIDRFDAAAQLAADIAAKHGEMADLLETQSTRS
ncbi:hypothetical protein CA606_18345 [Caulobacter vibrioides]|uniref:Uncharacterized protein n=1 Tax=Caulobacter vibrioides TaxID=155892 RepID=A0A290N342_CAUVI|nr:hypothetical protein [Caulobacter vibrioides]ATC34134.1 hypothetical protein CA606_18345 [Caulobacter vibrioides]